MIYIYSDICICMYLHILWDTDRIKDKPPTLR